MNKTENLLEKLVSIGERQLQGEAAATELLSAFLRTEGIPFSIQTYNVDIPHCVSAVLIADGKEVTCAGTSFASGIIPDKEIILSSAMPMAESPDLPNININPYCTAISKANHYRKPSVAVTHASLMQVLRARQVRGEVQTELVTHEAHNILVGNTERPEVIVFTHYDSVGPGAFDNASGTVAVCEALRQSPALRERSLCVLSGAEELSTDLPHYWGAGYRRFQEQYPGAMHAASKILVIDSVGSGEVMATRDPRVVRRAFPIANMEALLHKIELVAADLTTLMPVYHSELDTMNVVERGAIEQAMWYLLRSV